MRAGAREAADEHEIAWDRPIDPAEWGVRALPAGPGLRARLAVTLPEPDADLALVLDQHLGGDPPPETYADGRERIYWTPTESVSRDKMDLAARLVRRHEEFPEVSRGIAADLRAQFEALGRRMHRGMRRAGEADPGAERDPATALMYEAAEREYARIGERHDYSGLGAGVEAVLREMGGLADASSREMTSRFHNDMVGHASQLGRGELTFADVARSLDRGYFPSREDAELPFPFEDVVRGSRRYAGSRDTDASRHMSVARIAADVAKALKAERIRRGSARHREFLEKHAETVIAAAEDAARGAMAAAARDAERAIPDEEKLLREAHGAVAGAARAADVRAAALRAAGMEPDPSLAEIRAQRAEKWDEAVERLGHSLADLSDARESMSTGEGARDLAVHSLAMDDALRPFLDAAGVAYELPDWKRADVERAGEHRAGQPPFPPYDEPHIDADPGPTDADLDKAFDDGAEAAMKHASGDLVWPDPERDFWETMDDWARSPENWERAFADGARQAREGR